jgi:hypothetical protein
MPIWVDYTGGIDHPAFWTACRRCQRRHGPYGTLALIPTHCEHCDAEDRARLRAYIESLYEGQHYAREVSARQRRRHTGGPGRS